jgi:hypothetical protein
MPKSQIKSLVAIGSSGLYSSTYQHSHMDSNIDADLIENVSTSWSVVGHQRHRMRVGSSFSLIPVLTLHLDLILVFTYGPIPLSGLCKSRCGELQGCGR